MAGGLKPASACQARRSPARRAIDSDRSEETLGRIGTFCLPILGTVLGTPTTLLTLLLKD